MTADAFAFEGELALSTTLVDLIGNTTVIVDDDTVFVDVTPPALVDVSFEPAVVRPGRTVFMTVVTTEPVDVFGFTLPMPCEVDGTIPGNGLDEGCQGEDDLPIDDTVASPSGASVVVAGRAGTTFGRTLRVHSTHRRRRIRGAHTQRLLRSQRESRRGDRLPPAGARLSLHRRKRRRECSFSTLMGSRACSSES